MTNMQARAPDECLWPADDNEDVCNILAHLSPLFLVSFAFTMGTFYYADFMQNVDDVVAHELSMCVYRRYTQHPDRVDDLLARYEQAGIPRDLLVCTDARVRLALGMQARDL